MVCVVPQEFLHYAVGSILVLIASIVAAVKTGGISVLVVGSVPVFKVRGHMKEHMALVLCHQMAVCRSHG
ncbi:hypothetical protein CRUP_014918 [Coryphaenoides rupestris]|nr:hypothetical protein CRUP_014918 [Coryphaenoides rupestris]